MGEFEGGGEAGLLVEAAEVTDQIDNGVLFFEGFIGQGVIEVIEGLFNLVSVVGADVLIIGIVQEFQDGVRIGAEFLHIHSSVLLVVGGEVETGVGVEFLEFDLGFEAVLSFHHNVYQFVPVVVPFLDAPKVARAAFIVDDERHHAVAQTFFEHNQSAHTTVTVLEGEDFLEADVEVQNVIALNLGLLFVGGNQFCQTGMDFVWVQELAIPGPGCNRPVLTGANLITVGVHGASHQNLMQLSNEFLAQGIHYVIQDVIHAMDMVQNLDYIGDL